MKRLSVRAELPPWGLSYLRGVSTVDKVSSSKADPCERKDLEEGYSRKRGRTSAHTLWHK